MLQLASVTHKVQPVTSANLTEFETIWFEPIIEDSIISSAELASQIAAQLAKLNAAASDQLNAVADQSTAARIQALKNAAESAQRTISRVMFAISELSADVARLTNSIQRATTTNLANPLVSLNSLSTQLQIAAQAPALATSNVQERADAFIRGISEFVGLSVDVPTPENKNFLAVKESALSALAGGLPLVVSTGELNTRSEALGLAEALANQFDEITNSLDADQKLYSNNLLENQYFSQSQTYTDTLRLFALGIEYLLRTSFDLKVEKRFKLTKSRTPIDITITEYGELGENDINLDLFITSNNLKNTEILLLDAGKEVVVYV